MAYLIISQNSEEVARRQLKGTTQLGRSPECGICIHDILLSRIHCKLHYARGAWRVEDLKSRNGTHVNGARVESHVLDDGDILRIGRTQIAFHRGALPRDEASFPNPLNRPADPFEALAGTVFAFELGDAAPPSALPAGMPRPKPAPVAPEAYERDGVCTLVLDMLSDLHDTTIMEAPRPRSRPKPIVRGTPPRATTRRPGAPAAATARGPSLLEQLAAELPPLPAPVAKPTKEARRTRRRAAPQFGLEFWVVTLMVVLAALASTATYALFALC